MIPSQSIALFSFASSPHHRAQRRAWLLVSILMFMLPAGCVVLPLPDVGHVSGRAVITEKDMDSLKAGEGVLTRRRVLLMLGEPNERYDRDEYFCYAWERMMAVWFVAGAGAYGPPFVFGDTIGKLHYLCMQFDTEGRLANVKHIDSDAKKSRDKILREWGKPGPGDEPKLTYDYYNLDKIKREVVQALAVKGIPEAQWRMYDEFGRKPDDIAWLCRSADNGYTRAQLEVGKLYWADSQMPQHKVKAFVWYRLATAGNKSRENPSDRQTLAEASNAIREAVNALDEDQLVEAYNIYSGGVCGQCELELAKSVAP